MSRLQRKRIVTVGKRRAAAYIISVLCLLSCFWVTVVREEAALPASAGAASDSGFWQHIVYKAVPVLEAYQENDGWQAHLYNGMRDAVYFFTQIRPDDITTLLRAELSYLPSVHLPVAAVSSRADVQPRTERSAAPFLDGQILVGIYHTHTSESFIPTSGKTHSPGGQRGEIVGVGQALADELERNGIGALHSDTIHDYPSFMRAYGASEETVRQMVQNNPSLRYVFDIHRDAESRPNVVVQLGERTIASISIIVAQGREGLEQPHWKENYAAAQRIKQKCDEKYPGLIREIQFAEWRYNEHLHKGLLLLEVGSHETSADEAIEAIVCFGDALNEVLREGD